MVHKLIVAAILPILIEAFIHHPGMYGGGYHNDSSESKSTTIPKTQAEKLKDPWLWVCVIAFSICMFFCLRISIAGRWR